MNRTLRLVSGLAAVSVIAGCGETTSMSAPEVALESAADHVPYPIAQHLIVCKEGSQATFDWSVDDGTNGVVSVADGACEVVVRWWAGDPPKTVTVTENAVTGYALDHVGIEFGVGFGPMPQPDEPGPTIVKTIGNDLGWRLTYHNVLTPTQEGGEGCTPGYWKQSQHFDSWQGYAPTDLFASVFEDAFGGMTLVQVLDQGGGGLNALGRHTVAALLNASSADVSYDLQPVDVVGAFNNVFPGTSTEYEAQKNAFEAFNVQGCPLS